MGGAESAGAEGVDRGRQPQDDRPDADIEHHVKTLGAHPSSRARPSGRHSRSAAAANATTPSRNAPRRHRSRTTNPSATATPMSTSASGHCARTCAHVRRAGRVRAGRPSVGRGRGRSGAGWVIRASRSADSRSQRSTTLLSRNAGSVAHTPVGRDCAGGLPDIRCTSPASLPFRRDTPTSSTAARATMSAVSMRDGGGAAIRAAGPAARSRAGVAQGDG